MTHIMSLKQIRCVLLFGIMFMTGCGNNNLTTGVAATPELKTFEFTATVNKVVGNPNFDVAVGDKLTGTFSYFITYPQQAPAGVTFNLSTITFNAYISNPNDYPIGVMDNDSSVDPVRDIFWWSATDPALAKQLQVDDVSAIFQLSDLTAKVFSNNALPATLNLSDFDLRYFSIGADTHTGNGITEVWYILFTVDEIKSKQ